MVLKLIKIKTGSNQVMLTVVQLINMHWELSPEHALGMQCKLEFWQEDKQQLIWNVYNISSTFLLQQKI